MIQTDLTDAELNILKTADEIRKTQRANQIEQAKKDRIKARKERKLEFKRQLLIEEQKEVEKKRVFDEKIADFTAELAQFDSHIKEQKRIISKAEYAINQINAETEKAKRAFYTFCVHDYGPRYYACMEGYKMCKICGHEQYC